MMELPESYALSRQVNENLRGKCISEAIPWDIQAAPGIRWMMDIFP